MDTNWEKLVQAEFHHQGTCHMHATKCTKNFYCISCEEGALCSDEFYNAHGRHSDHPNLQVRRNSRMYSVKEKDLQRYLDTTAIQKYISNEEVHVYVRRRELKGKSKLSPDHRSSVTTSGATCDGCLKPISLPRTGAGGSAKGSVCSLQCLVKTANAAAAPVQANNQLGSFAGGHACWRLISSPKENDHVSSVPPLAGASVKVPAVQISFRRRRRKQLSLVRSRM